MARRPARTRSARPSQHLCVPEAPALGWVGPAAASGPRSERTASACVWRRRPGRAGSPGPGPEHLLLLPGSPRTAGPRGSDPSVVRPRLPPAEPSESQELLSAQPPPSHSAQATWLRRVIFQTVDNVLRLLVPSAAHSRRPGSFAGPGLRRAPGQARDEAARSPSPASLDHVSIHPEGASPGIIWTVFSVAVG